MRILKTLLLLALFSGVIVCRAADYIVNQNFVTIPVKHPTADGAKMVRLQIINNNIVRVQATPGMSFPEKQSLIIVEQKYFAGFKVEQRADIVTVRTAELAVEVDIETGRVRFLRGPHILLSERAQGGKIFRPFRVPEREIGVGTLTEQQRNAWTWNAVFDSPADEAFYGLGQHQSEELNMKGKNEDLFQYNTKISIPFVVSNKNYGVLWDSYSYCRWGNPDEYQQLGQAFKIYNKDGRPGSLTGTYTTKNGSQQIVREEDSIYFENSETIVNLPKDFPLNGSHVVYEGEIEAPVENLYHFILYYAGYIKVYLDGREIVPERWRTAWNPNSYKFTYPMKAGQRASIKIDWKPDGDVSYCGLRTATPRTSQQQNQMSIWSEMARDMDYYLIAGNNLDSVVSGYRQLTGKAQVFPKWSFGFWQSRERYKTSNEIESTLRTFREKHIPVDNIVQDWNYWKLDSWGSHQFEPVRYPNPQAMLDSVHAMNGRFMISVWPKFYNTTDNYKQLDARGWMYHQAIKDSIHDWLGFMGSFYDAYSSGARHLFWQQMNSNLYEKYKQGIDAWWMDASEPNVRDCTPMWYRKALSGPTALGSSTEYFNAYSLMNANAIYNGQRSVNPNRRVFLLTRSGFAGQQRYSTASWSGDIATRWEDMRAQITAGLNYSIAGLPMWGMDQGGFCVEQRYVDAQLLFDKTKLENNDLKEWRELQTRWHQFGCFVPLYRAHGQWPLREVWNIAPENHPAYKTIVKYHRLRYRLMPYLYSMAGAVHLTNYTIMRPLIMDFNGDSAVNDIKDQWMFGPALMPCPVTEYGARSRQVYLPKQTGWFEFDTNRYYVGNQVITAYAPFESIPVFVPEGAIIPIGPEIEWTDQKPADPITLYVFQGRNGEFTLYEDEGTNYNYERGKFSTIRFTYNDADHTLTIGNRHGSYDGMLQSRTFRIVYRQKNSTVAQFDPDNESAKIIRYSGKQIKVKL